MNSQQLYLDLMKRCLTNYIYRDPSEMPGVPQEWLTRQVFRLCRILAIPFNGREPFDPTSRAEGFGWPETAHTMIGLKRLEHLEFCVTDVLARQVPGDLMETGVWRGGATIFMRAVLKAYGVADRQVWVADSFEGLPTPNPEKYPVDTNSDFQTFTQ